VSEGKVVRRKTSAPPHIPTTTAGNGLRQSKRPIWQRPADSKSMLGRRVAAVTGNGPLHGIGGQQRRGRTLPVGQPHTGCGQWLRCGASKWNERALRWRPGVVHGWCFIVRNRLAAIRGKCSGRNGGSTAQLLGLRCKMRPRSTVHAVRSNATTRSGADQGLVARRT